MTPARARAANLLGAVALVVTDQTRDRIAAASGQEITDATTLSALRQFLRGPSIDAVRRVLGLTPSGAVRLVDRLVLAGLVARGPGADGRTRSVRLTAKGRRTATRVSAERLGYLEQLLTGLSDDEVDTLHTLLSRVVTNVVDAKDGGAWTCRLCDLQACGRSEGLCPTAAAAAARFGAPT